MRCFFLKKKRTKNFALFRFCSEFEFQYQQLQKKLTDGKNITTIFSIVSASISLDIRGLTDKHPYFFVFACVQTNRLLRCFTFYIVAQQFLSSMTGLGWTARLKLAKTKPFIMQLVLSQTQQPWYATSWFLLPISRSTSSSLLFHFFFVEQPTNYVQCWWLFTECCWNFSGRGYHYTQFFNYARYINM